MERLYGRGKVIDFVKAALKCDDVGNQPLPILLLVGPRGSGGSALLAKLWEEVGDDCPCVRLDLTDAEDVSKVLWVAMQGLLRHVGGIRQLRFPRLTLAGKALDFRGDAHDQTAFDTYMKMGGRATNAGPTLKDWTDQAAPLLPSLDQQVVAKIAARLLGEVLSGFDRRRDTTSLRWFAEESAVAGGDGFDPLWRLYQWRHGQDGAKQYRADKTLCDAFLTDLRTDYNNTGIRHARRTRNPVLLFDNADSVIGKHLLELIAECRRESHRAGRAADPLLIVPVQGHPPSRQADKPIEASEQDPEKDLNFARWRAATRHEYLTLWCPVYLSALSDSEVVEVTSSQLLGVSPRVHRDADFIRSLTGGHPEATGRLAELLRKLDSPADLRSLLDHPVPRELRGVWATDMASTSVGDHLLRRAFGDGLRTLPKGGIDPENNTLLDAMAAGAVTPGFGLSACQKVLDQCEWKHASAVEARDELTETMWWRAEPDDGEPYLHPLASLLLRHWLARQPAKWAKVHEGYDAHYSRPADIALRHRHKLALVSVKPQLDDVAKFLDREWDRGPGQEAESGGDETRHWLDVLSAVASAPNRLPTLHHPEVSVRALAGSEEPGNRRQVIARLAVARWLFNDRLFDPGHQLARVIADEYHHLAQLPGGDGNLLLEEEAKYRTILREWGD